MPIMIKKAESIDLLIVAITVLGGAIKQQV
jgi:hypothetical protein